MTPKSALDALKEFTEQKIAPLLLLMKEPEVRDIRSTEEPETEYVNPYADLAEDYDALSEAIYNDVLGEFAEAYEAAIAAKLVSIQANGYAM